MYTSFKCLLNLIIAILGIFADISSYIRQLLWYIFFWIMSNYKVVQGRKSCVTSLKYSLKYVHQ